MYNESYDIIEKCMYQNKIDNSINVLNYENSICLSLIDDRPDLLSLVRAGKRIYRHSDHRRL
jgi:hypothetical protein